MEGGGLAPSELVAAGVRVGTLLKERQEDLAVAEGAGGGLASAAVLAVPGASAYYRGGAVIYTAAASRAFMAGSVEVPAGMRGATEEFALWLARSARARLGVTWGLGEGGAAGPAGNPYGDPAGHAWVAVSGPIERTQRVATGSDHRADNMAAFALAGLALLESCIEGGPAVTVFCRARLNYAGSGGLAGAPVEVEILDARAADLPGWSECGFELVDRVSAVSHWDDDGEIASVHYAETEALSRELTGCDLALVSDHVRRRAVAGGEGRAQSPVHLVHSDFAAGYDTIIRTAYRGVKGRGAATLSRTGAKAEDVETARRIVMMQFWRNLGPARMDFPVAFCDARTVTPAEVLPFRYNGYVAGGRSFDALAVAHTEHTPQHRWFTYPEMTAAEVVAFRTYDTELVEAGVTYFTPHSAFRDPRVPPGQPGRTSIELRVMCLWH